MRNSQLMKVIPIIPSLAIKLVITMRGGHIGIHTTRFGGHGMTDYSNWGKILPSACARQCLTPVRVGGHTMTPYLGGVYYYYQPLQPGKRYISIKSSKST